MELKKESTSFEEIDKYLSDLRPSGSADPRIRPYCPWPTTIWYYFCGIFEMPLIILLEITYFLLTGYGYFTARMKYKRSSTDDGKNADSAKNIDSEKEIEGKHYHSISIIVPCLNESENIEMLLLYIEKHCFDKKDVEIILIDGGSTDEWYLKLQNERLKKLTTIPIKLIHFNQHKQSGRGICQNIAAKQYANNDILIFLHCDTIVCNKFDQIARNKINEDNNLLIGSWGFALDNGSMPYPLIGLNILQYRVNLKSRLFQCAWGDHGYFMTNYVFNNILNGMPNQCIMEDYHFAANARKYALINGKNIFIDDNNYFYTSPRKWYKSGAIWKNTIRNQVIVFLYQHRGYSPKQIYKLYYGQDLPQTS